MNISVNERKNSVCCICKMLALHVTSEMLNIKVRLF